ncbi:MAG: hypothetical protein JWR53_2101 [Glaciihabitans sp.]|nr:hypothetical protein [Glaciihabitans sp.]
MPQLRRQAPQDFQCRWRDIQRVGVLPQRLAGEGVVVGGRRVGIHFVVVVIVIVIVLVIVGFRVVVNFVLGSILVWLVVGFVWLVVGLEVVVALPRARETRRELTRR